MPARKHQLRTNYEIDKRLTQFYSSGKFLISNNQSSLLFPCGEKINVVSMETGLVVKSFEHDDGDEVICFTVSDEYLVSASRRLLLRQWNLEDQSHVRTWKAAHHSPILSICFDSSATLIATGSVDCTVKVFDIVRKYHTHNFKGFSTGVSMVKFYPSQFLYLLFAASDDGAMKIFSLKKNTQLFNLTGHFERINDISFHLSSNTGVSVSRDNVAIVWNIDEVDDSLSISSRKLVPLMDVAEYVCCMSPPSSIEDVCSSEDIVFLTAGQKGVLKFWNANTGECVKAFGKLSKDRKVKSDLPSITGAVYCEARNEIIASTFEENIIFYSLATLKVTKQLCGNLDQVLSLACFDNEDVVAIAASSSLIHLYNWQEGNSWLVAGHSDTVLQLTASGNFLASSSKDNTIRFWRLDVAKFDLQCIGIGVGHTLNVLGVAVSPLDCNFVASVSEDCTIKVWEVETDAISVQNFHVKWTSHAHDKQINCVCISPDDKLIATGGHDKLVKIWSSNGSALTTLRGHNKGIWSLDFSPIESLLVSTSGDATLRIWNLLDYTCLHSLQGHDCAVVSAVYLSSGSQLISSGTDGLIKLWNTHSGSCDLTMEGHQGQIWGLAIATDSIISGGSDGQVIKWRDTTDEVLTAKTEETHMLLKMNQDLQNLIQTKRHVEAIALAIKLDMPSQLFALFSNVLSSGSQNDIIGVLSKLEDSDIFAVMNYLVKWNTNTKYVFTAQNILEAIFRILPPDKIVEHPEGKNLVENLLCYSERHFLRIDKVLEKSYLLDHLWFKMRDITLPADKDASMELDESHSSVEID